MSFSSPNISPKDSTTTATKIKINLNIGSPQQRELVNIITPSDVLCGRGKKIQNHEGNFHFRMLLQKYKDYYHAESMSNAQKASIVSEVLAEVQRLNPPGRFLEVDMKSELWMDIGRIRSARKVKRGFRDIDTVTVLSFDNPMLKSSLFESKLQTGSDQLRPFLAQQNQNISDISGGICKTQEDVAAKNLSSDLEEMREISETKVLRRQKSRRKLLCRIHGQVATKVRVEGAISFCIFQCCTKYNGGNCSNEQSSESIDNLLSEDYVRLSLPPISSSEISSMYMDFKTSITTSGTDRLYKRQRLSPCV